MKESVSGMLLMLLLIGMFTLVFNIRSASAQGETIFINVDGSITPSSAPISTVDNVTYILTGNMTYPTFTGVFVERSNIVIDGNGYTLQGNQSAYGISWANSVNNVTIKNTNIEGFFYGVEIYNSFDNTVCDCNITNNGEGIELAFSSSNKLNGNDVANNVYDGIVLGASDSSLVGNNIANNEGDGILLAGSDNGMVGNTIANNLYGIYFSTGANNVLYHNDFVRNHFQVFTWYAPQNNWDKGYPSGGNYWSDYNGTDLYSGPYQNVTGSDGIGDTPYVIDFLDIDHYPLMNPYNASSLFAFISPGSATLDVGQSQNFTSIVTGGTPPYVYNWVLNGTFLPDATSSSWTFTPTSHGSYTVNLSVVDSLGVLANSNTASVLAHAHEVAVTNVTASTTWVYRGGIPTINVTVKNVGDFNESTVSVTLYYNVTAGKSINTYPLYLGVEQSLTLTFTWNTNGVPYQNYTLTAVAAIPTGSSTLSDGNITIKLLGDINGDGRVDLRDLALVARALGSTPTSPNWNLAADLNGDGVVNMKDIAIVARNFGQHYP